MDILYKNVPSRLRERLEYKMSNDLFDIGHKVSFRPKHLEKGNELEVVCVEQIAAYEDVYLIDHMFSFRNMEEARAILHQSEVLRQRILSMLNLQRVNAVEYPDVELEVRTICDNMWPFVGVYVDPLDVVDNRITSSSSDKTFYILDEVGSRLACSNMLSPESCSMDSCLVWKRTGNGSAQYAVTACWPIREVDEGEVITITGSGYPTSIHKRLAMRFCLDNNSDVVDVNDNEVVDIEEMGSLRLGCDEKSQEFRRFRCLKELYLRLSEANYCVEGVQQLLKIESLGALLPVWEISNSKHRSVLMSSLLSDIKSRDLSDVDFTSMLAPQTPNISQQQLAGADQLLFRDDYKDNLNNTAFISSNGQVQSDAQRQLKSCLAALVLLFLMGGPLEGTVLINCMSPFIGTCFDERNYSEEGLALIHDLLELNILYLIPADVPAISVFENSNINLTACDSKAEDSALLVKEAFDCCDEISSSRIKDIAMRHEKVLRLLRGNYHWYSSVQITPVSLPIRQPPFAANDRCTLSPNLSNLLLMTDWAQTSSYVGFDPVMYIGPDSLSLVHINPCQQYQAANNGEVPRRALDLCSGSGIQALSFLKCVCSVSSHCGNKSNLHPSACLVDLNPRAVRFSIANAHLNGLEHYIAVELGDVTKLNDTKAIYQGEDYPDGARDDTDRLFDIVLMNPPYIPSTNILYFEQIDYEDLVDEGSISDSNAELSENEESVDDDSHIDEDSQPSSKWKVLQAYGDGGHCGEDVTRAAISIANLGPKLNRMSRRPVLFIVANLMDPITYPSKIRSWLDQLDSHRANVYVAHGALWTLEQYASLILGESNVAGTARYVASLADSGVSCIANGLVFTVFSDDGDQIQRVDISKVWEGPAQLWQQISIQLPNYLSAQNRHQSLSVLADICKMFACIF